MRTLHLRHHVRIQTLAVSVNEDSGEQTEVWTDAYGGPIPAEILPLSGRELIEAEATQSRATGRIIIRYLPGVKTSMRVLDRETRYDIEAVIPDAETGYHHLTLLVSSGTNEG